MTGAVVDLPGSTVIGCNNVIGHHSLVGMKYKVTFTPVVRFTASEISLFKRHECFLEIGDNNEIREHTSIHRFSKPSEKTVIGDNNLIMGSCHNAHDCKVGSYNIFANKTLLAGHVVVEDLSLCMISILQNTKFVVNSCPSPASGGDNLLQTIDPKC
ncbi:probable acyl-[acyl-carrier-protein]--UDP-N-acetylglucosamine O-acyltransferase, mitochondrial isoform X4 [Actinidia eriantha]|uniref:probable acyl-[acyl-carrier-protein]--UDP-N-acetylglucosamine O-acyltransferase, mitochondrial isoform X4 n=1 Tax=Actinidia eriantha TaxID=165200 RepID=UPI00258510A7|nr:probable acyl-[acyl-carrier-protein]--UDP-N-acetylglucosamine O-acyltransferase, mitochondrial isoform X4 [Actinidia eriantha]